MRSRPLCRAPRGCCLVLTGAHVQDMSARPAGTRGDGARDRRMGHARNQGIREVGSLRRPEAGPQILIECGGAPTIAFVRHLGRRLPE